MKDYRGDIGTKIAVNLRYQVRIKIYPKMNRRIILFRRSKKEKNYESINSSL